tara:strand:- start:142 stop:522 length:381 start_codon:yes stop_codon:yes gene_type:complete
MKKLKKTKSIFPPELANSNGVKIKVYFNGHMIGAGKMQLIQLINLKGSISSAAKTMGMSTKRADKLLKSIEDAFANPVVIKQKGNKGTIISKFGKELLDKYLNLCQDLSKESEDFITWAISKQTLK